MAAVDALMVCLYIIYSYTLRSVEGELYTYQCGFYALLVQLFRAMRRPQVVGRAISMAPTSFFYGVSHFFTSLKGSEGTTL